MMSKLNLIFLCVFVAGLIGQSSAESSKVEELYKQLQESYEKMSKIMKDAIVIPEDLEKDKAYQAVKAAVGKTAETLKETLVKIEKDAKPYSEEFQKNVQAALKQMSETLKQVKDKDTQVKLEKIYETYTTALKKIGEQTTELGKSVGVQVPDKLQASVHEISEQFGKYYQAIQAKFAEIIEEPKKKRP